MNKNTQFQMVDFFIKNGINDFVGVPDSTLKHFISCLIKKNKIIISTREDEAIGIAAGVSISGVSSLVFIQNAGFANSLSTINYLIDLLESLNTAGMLNLLDIEMQPGLGETMGVTIKKI